MEHVPFSVENVPYSTKYITRVTYTFHAIYGPTELFSLRLLEHLYDLRENNRNKYYKQGLTVVKCKYNHHNNLKMQFSSTLATCINSAQRLSTKIQVNVHPSRLLCPIFSSYWRVTAPILIAEHLDYLRWHVYILHMYKNLVCWCWNVQPD